MTKSFSSVLSIQAACAYAGCAAYRYYRPGLSRCGIQTIQNTIYLTHSSTFSRTVNMAARILGSAFIHGIFMLSCAAPYAISPQLYALAGGEINQEQRDRILILAAAGVFNAMIIGAYDAASYDPNFN